MRSRRRNYYTDLLARYGFEPEAERIRERYLAGHTAEAVAAVPDDAVRSMNLIGSPGFVRDRFAAFREAGVTVLNLRPLGPDPIAMVELVRGWM